MQFGAYMFCTDYSIRPDDLARLLDRDGAAAPDGPEAASIGDLAPTELR